MFTSITAAEQKTKNKNDLTTFFFFTDVKCFKKIVSIISNILKLNNKIKKRYEITFYIIYICIYIGYRQAKYS